MVSHWRVVAFACLVAALLLGMQALAAQAQSANDDATWFEVQGDQARVHLYFFWSASCPHCREAHPFVEALPQKYPWLELHSMEISQNQANAQRYMQMAQAIGEEALYVPAFFMCGSMTAGYDKAETSGAVLADVLERCYAWVLENHVPKPAGAVPVPAPVEALAAIEAVAAAPPAQGVAPAVALPVVGALDVQSFSLPALTVVIAGLDAFNPCAFFVLMFLLSLMVHAKSRSRMALIGGVFVLFSGLIYFIFMAAWLNIFLVLGELALITTLAGLVAMGIAALNIKDFFWFKQGVSLSIPERAKPTLYQRSRNLLKASSLPALLAGTAVLAIAANSYELLCTSGFPMVYTRALTLHDLPSATFYLYLAFYNLVYIMPLLLIVAIFTARFGAHKLTEREGRVLKLVSGIMMLLLGLLLVVAPGQLNDVTTALLLLLVSLVLTAILVWVDDHWIHSGGSLKAS